MLFGCINSAKEGEIGKDAAIICSVHPAKCRSVELRKESVSVVRALLHAVCLDV